MAAGALAPGITRSSAAIILTRQDEWALNLVAPGRFEWKFRQVIFKHILVIDGWSITCKIALWLMSLDDTDDKSTLVQVMAWCTSHYLSQSCPRSVSPYGITRPQWVNLLVVFYEGAFQQPMPSQCWERIENTNMFLCFLYKFSMTRVDLQVAYSVFWNQTGTRASAGLVLV